MKQRALCPVILLAFANDRGDGGDYLRNLPAELRGIRERLDAAEEAGLCEVLIRPNVTTTELLDLFQDPRYRDRITIFHYGGHAGDVGLLLESDAGEPIEAHARGLAELLGTLPSLRLVFLNGCATEPQAEHLLATGVPGVIVTAGSIDDEVATELAVRFYGGLSAGGAIGAAFRAAVGAVRLAWGEAPEALHRPGRPSGRWPWQFLARPGDDRAASWSLAAASGDPLFGLPELPLRDLPESPFLHIEWYREEHAEIFFGRGREIRAIRERVIDPAASPILLLHGQSGVGKSSLLAAGLIPRLREAVDVRHSRRDRDRGLAGTLLDLLGAGDRSTAPEAWHAAEAASGRPLVVILDQVEEVFTRPGPPGELVQFVTELERLFLPLSARPRGRLVLAFRKEWLADIDERLRERGLPRARFFVERLDRAGIMEVVEGPARTDRLRHRYRLMVEPGLAAIIADDLLEDPNAVVAPTLAILLSKMWTQATVRDADSPRFDRDLYQAMRRSGLLLGDFLDEQIATLRTEDAEAVDSGLALDLLAFHTTSHGTAEYRSASDLATAYAHRHAQLAALVEHCQSLHLLTRFAASTGEASSSGTRLSHDTLAPLVRRRFEESDRAGQRARRILDGRSAAWQGGESGPTLDAIDLATVEAGAAGTRVWTDAENRLVLASRTRRSHARWLRAGVVVAGIVAVALIVNQTRTARLRAAEAESRALAAAAWNEPETENAVLLGIQALRSADTFEARSALLGRMYAPLPRLRRTLAADGSAETVVMSPDGTIIAAGAGDVIQLWDAATGAPFREPLAGHTNSIMSLAFSPDGRLLASAAFESRVLLWDTRTWQPVGGPIEHPRSVLDLTFSTSGDELLTGGFDGMVRFWDPRTARPTRDPLQVDRGAVSAIALAPDDRTLAVVAGYLGSIWDIETRRPLTDSISVDGQVFALALSRDASLLALGGGGLNAGGSIRIIEVGTGIPRGEPLSAHRSQVETLAFAGDRLLVSASGDGAMQLWDTESRSPIGEPLSALAGGLAFHSGVKDVFVSADRATLLSASTDGLVRQWELFEWEPMSDSLPQDFAASVAFQPDGMTLVTSGRGVRRWNAITRDSIGTTFFGAGARPVLAASPDGATFAGISTVDVRLWRMDDTTGIRTLRGHSATLYAVAFDPSGTLLATAGADETIRLWDSSTQEPAGPPLEGHEDDILAIAFHPMGRWLASAGEDQSVRFWTVPGGQFRGGFYGHRGSVRAVAFSPDGSLLATGGDDGVARIWRLIPPPDTSVDTPMDVEQLGDPLIGHEYAVTSVAFSPDGRLLATGGNDGAVRTWDVATQRSLGRGLDAYRGAIRGLAFSGDGAVLAAAADGGLRLWPMTPAGWIARACRLARRNLPARIWARLIPSHSYECTCAEYPPAADSGLASCEG